ncbi:DUF1318 domain-containing protein [Sphingomonas sp.]|uniref:DUF1318 domain-containing protein n=1 Tax=Sphingomonas sp. TaxID=28214 RepID=UPI00286B3C76|nr:DUF1318 domain-containing protein [Sphingomonas sp.]
MTIGAGVLLWAVPLAAQSAPAVVAARAAGQIGERYDGYLGYAVATGPAVRSQVDAVNIRRRALFTDLAVKRGASPQEVGIAVGCELLGGVVVGEAYLLADNVWRRRSAGQPLPIPDYCRP